MFVLLCKSQLAEAFGQNWYEIFLMLCSGVASMLSMGTFFISN